MGCFVKCFVRCFVKCFVECFLGCLAECFVGRFVGCFALCFVKRFAARHSAAQPLARCHHHRYLLHCHCPSPNSGVLKRFPGSPRFCPSIVGAFGRGSDSPLLLRPASELNRILSSSWSSAPRVSIGASSGRATGYGSSSLRSRSVRPGVGCQGRLDPQRNRAQHTPAQHDTFQVSTARHGTAQPLAQYIAVDTFSIASGRRPVRCREIVSMLHMSIFLSGFVGRSCCN